VLGLKSPRGSLHDELTMGQFRDAGETRMSTQRGNQGVLAGLLGCGFGVLGILTLGIVFVPLAALCSLVGLINGLHGNGSGLATSALGGVLTAVGFAFSPSLWVVTGGLLLAHHNQSPVSAAPVNISRPTTPTPPITIAAKEAENAIAECRAKRLNGVLKTFEASAICSGDRIMQAYSDVGYKHMDLIAEFTGKRITISRMVDQHQLTEAQADEQIKRVLLSLQQTERQRDGVKN
jgi:hypothetical protein